MDTSYSAYEDWIGDGNTGTYADFVESMKTPQVIKGDKGDKGDPGFLGKQSGYETDLGSIMGHAIGGTIAKEFDARQDKLRGPKGDKGEPGTDGLDGVDGLSIKGDKGDKGDPGRPGRDGIDGVSIKGDKGDPGSKGDKGEKGDDGKSAYQSWLDDGNKGSENDYHNDIAKRAAVIGGVILSPRGTAQNITGLITAGSNVTITGTGTKQSPYNISSSGSGGGNLTGAITSVGTVTSLGSFTSAQLAGALTDETGTGSAVFATSPVLVTPNIGAATGTSLTTTGNIQALNLVSQATIAASNTITTTRNNLAATSTDGLIETNVSNSSAGTPVQYSPALRLSGTAWNGTASQTSNWRIENRPISGSPVTSQLTWSYDLNGGGYTTKMTLSDAGNLATTSFNGVALTTGGSANQFLNGAGSYTAPFTLTTTGTSGAATFTGGTLNIPQYTGGGGSGTVNSGTANQVAYYATTGTAVSGNANFTSDSSGNVSASGSISASGNLFTNTRFNLGNDVSIAPVVGGQSYIGTYWGMQLGGNQQVIPSGVTPANIGSPGDYGVIVLPGTTGQISFMTRLAASQSGAAYQIQNSSGTPLYTISSSGAVTTGTWNGTAIATTYGGAPSGGNTGQVLTKNSNTSYDYSWATPSGGSSFDPKSQVYIFTDFIEGSTKCPYTLTNSGAGSSVANTFSSSVGTVAGYFIQAGTSTSGSASVGTLLFSLNPALNNQNLETRSRFFLSSLPTSTDDYNVFVGFYTQSSSTTLLSNGSSFGLLLNSSFTNFQLMKRVGSTVTYVDSGVAAAGGTNYDIRVVSTGNSTAGSVVISLYINGSAVATTTGIDSSSYASYPVLIQKTAGTNDRYAAIDFAYTSATFPAPRY